MFPSYVRWMEPSFEYNWHHDVLLEELHEWAVGSVDRLMVFMPPRMAKSLFGSKLLPSFIHGVDPDARVMLASYSSDLAEEHSRASQQYILSSLYQDLFSNTQLAANSPRSLRNKLLRMRADMYDVAGHRGFYRAAGVGGSFTGHGLTHGIVDDPFKNREQAESATVREAVKAWWRSTFVTRRDNSRAKLLLIMTRWHEDDLAGWLIKLAEETGRPWRVVSMPAIMDEEAITTAHEHDLRDIGDALWPSQFSAQDLAELRGDIGEYDWQALMQQRPTPPGGAKIPVGKFIYVSPEDVPADVRWTRFWDLAVSIKTTADYTASGLVGVSQPVAQPRRVYIKDVLRGRWPWPQTRKLIIETAEAEGVPVGIETSGQQEGFFDDLNLENVFARVGLIGIKPDKDKLTRALPWIAAVDDNRFHLVRSAWNAPFLSECAVFTGNNDVHDDQVDFVSGGWELLATSYGNLTGLMAQHAGALMRGLGG